MQRAGAPAASRASPVRILLPFAFAYVLSYLYRSVNAIIAPDLTAQFALSSAQLGLLTSAYFLAFAAFQLPLGLLLDRFGPRRTDAALLIVAAAGALVFALAAQFSALALGRALIGLGVSGCLMSSIKANVLWFPRERWPALNAWMFFSGGIGMAVATVPVQAALAIIDWHTLFAVFATATVAAAAIIYWTVPERTGEQPVAGLREQLQDLRAIFAARRFWSITLAATATQATNMSVQGLWAGPWLSDVAGLSRASVATHLLAMALATMVGFLLWGNLAGWLGRRGVSHLRVLIAGMAAFLSLQLLLVIGVRALPYALWIGFGLLGTCGSLAYAILSHRFPPAQAGRVNTALNSLVFGCAFFVQWGIGLIIDLWPPLDGHYHHDAYRAAFGACVLVQLAAFAWLLREARAGH